MSPTPASQTTSLRERNKREKLDRIVAAATELFRDQGFDETTARQISARAGVGAGTLFLYVRDKRELLARIFEPRARRTFERLPVGLAPDEACVDGLMRLFGAFYRLYAKDTEISRLFVQELLFRQDSGESKVRMDALRLQLAERLGAVVHDAQRRGELRKDCSVHELADAFGAHYVMWLQLWLGAGLVGPRTAERRLRAALELQLAGLAA